MRSLAFAFTLSFTSCAFALSLVLTYGLGVNENESAAQRAAERQARDRCMMRNGAVRHYIPISIELEQMPDTPYSAGGEAWVAQVEARCLIL